MSYSYQHTELLTGIPRSATSPPVMHLLVLVYARSMDNRLGFEPGVSWLSGVTARWLLWDALRRFTWKGKKKNREVVSDQSKLSRNITSHQEEEDLGTGRSSLGAWTRMLQDEDSHRTTPWWQLLQGLGKPGREEETREGFSARSSL